MKTIPFLLGLILITGCQHQSGENMSDLAIDDQFKVADMQVESMPISRQAMAMPESQSDNLPVNDIMVVDKKKIIKDGRMGLKVDDLQTSKSNIDSLVKSHDSYTANERYYDTDTESTYHLTIRIPAQNFETIMAAIEKGKDKVLYKESDARDVTEQFIDLETRLENKRNYLNRYRELLKQATTVKDILEIEEKTRMIEEEIESTTARLRYLNDQVTYSTLNLMITQEKAFRFTPEKKDRFLERFKLSLAKGWSAVVDTVLLMVKIWPLYLLIIIIIFAVRIFRTRSGKNAA